MEEYTCFLCLLGGNSYFCHSPNILFDMNSYIFLDNVRFFAYHGVGQQEREVGNEFVINLKLKVDIARAAETDDVTHTVSYADVYENVKAEMEIPSKLLEHVCGRIIKRLFRTFPTVKAIELKLAKRNPPMGADLDAAEWKCNVKELNPLPLFFLLKLNSVSNKRKSHTVEFSSILSTSYTGYYVYLIIR